ncbi:glycosyl hydrolase family 25 [Kineothrix alysoides]|uniref:Glycosyl hydrolase family 25 n=1 Tax=Kineothrix alysoides TaxID=1469948 RepID=A0A4R1R1S5_9FIRM|nr:glycoside hydrolase family 25 protein [Kineothrix alysoides]TCL59300.1 glycosyl hydrolase family 25 [Kineothrix alysoides]
MGSRLKNMTVFLVIIMFVAVMGSVLYANKDFFNKREEQEVSAEVPESTKTQEDVQTAQIGSDERSFLTDETFFDPDKKPYSSIEKMSEKNLSLLMTSVEKDLRIQVVDNAGKLVKGESFCAVLNGDKEYPDEDQDGVIYIDHLRAGSYEVTLKEMLGYRVPDTPARIEVKQSVEYVAIDDISLLIFTEEDVDPALEDLEVNGAEDDADNSEITKMQANNPNAKIGIDVSKWNKEIDWDKVKSEGVEFAIIRVGYRGATTGALIEDPYFKANIKGALNAGIPVGVYFFTQAVSTVEAVEEASMVINMCKDYNISYPVFIDTEGAGGNGRADGLELEARTQVCKAFCATMESAGYRAGVYGARNWFNEMLDMSSLKDYIIWLAEYRDVPVYQGYYHMWQYTSGGTVDGIEGKVDFSLSYLKIESPKAGDAENSEGIGAQPKAGEPLDGEIVEPKAIGGTEKADW